MLGLLKKNKKNEELNIEINEEKLEPTCFETNNKKLKDLIAVDYLDFSESPKYVACGDKYLKNFYIGIMPAMVDFPTFLDDLYNFGNIDTSIYVMPIDSEVAKSELSKLRTNLEIEFNTAGGSINRRDDMEAKVIEAKRLREEVRDGHNKIYDVLIVATLYADTLRELENLASTLRQVLARRDIGLKSAIYIQEEAYKTNKPLLKPTVDEWHTFDKRSLACIFPFTTSNINHANGVPIGINVDNGLPVIYDTFHPSLTNYNMVVFAKSGGGKSTFIKMLAARGITFDNIINVCIDIEPEYRDIALTLGGVNITITHNTNTIINFFDITPEKKKNKLTGQLREVVDLTSKINSVTAIILTMSKGFTGNNDEFFNDITREIIRDCVVKVYENINITDDVSSLYNIDKSKKLMPTLSDWYKILQEKSVKNEDSTYIKYYAYLLSVMKNYCKITNGGFTCFDGQSTVNLDYDIPFINFDVSELNEETELPIAQHIICDYIWETLIKKNDIKKTSKVTKLRVIIDEAWRMAIMEDNKPKFPEAINFLIKMFRRARKKNTSAVVISQQFNEFYNEVTKPIIRNSDTKVFLPPDDTSIDEIGDVFNLSQGEVSYISKITKGEALMKCGSDSVKLKVEIPDFELGFVETNQNAYANRIYDKKIEEGA